MHDSLRRKETFRTINFGRIVNKQVEEDLLFVLLLLLFSESKIECCCSSSKFADDETIGLVINNINEEEFFNDDELTIEKTKLLAKSSETLLLRTPVQIVKRYPHW